MPLAFTVDYQRLLSGILTGQQMDYFGGYTMPKSNKDNDATIS